MDTFSFSFSFLRGITGHQWIPLKGQWLEALIFSSICASTNGWANNRDTGDVTRYSAHQNVTEMLPDKTFQSQWSLHVSHPVCQTRYMGCVRCKYNMTLGPWICCVTILLKQLLVMLVYKKFNELQNDTDGVRIQRKAYPLRARGHPVIFCKANCLSHDMFCNSGW